MNDFKVRDLMIPILPQKKGTDNFRLINFENEDQSTCPTPSCASPSCKPSCNVVGSKYVDTVLQQDTLELGRLKRSIAKLQTEAV